MLTISHLTKTFHPGSANERVALRDVSLTVKQGEFVTIIGGNGAGKSTLFGAIGGSFLPDAGRVLLNDRDITFDPAYRRSAQIGRLFQDPMQGTAPRMTIAENLTLACRSDAALRGMRRPARTAFFKEKLAELGLGLEDRIDSPVGLLSGGQRQALTLLMATIVPPQLLLLDEHTAALDPATAEKVLALTERIVKEQALTCMVITHQIESALRLGTRTLMLENGALVLDVQGEQRARLTVGALLEKFKGGLDNDRMLLG